MILRTTPFFPPSGPATGFSIGLDPKSNFLAINHLKEKAGNPASPRKQGLHPIEHQRMNMTSNLPLLPNFRAGRRRGRTNRLDDRSKAMPRCVRAVIVVGITCVSLLRADITLVDYTTNPSEAGSPARQSFSSSSDASNVFGPNGAAVFFTIDLSNVQGSASISNFSVLMSSTKYPANPTSVFETIELFRNYSYTIAILPYVESIQDTQEAFASSPYAWNVNIENIIATSAGGATAQLGTNNYDVIRISIQADTLQGFSIAGGNRYSAIFQVNDYIDPNGPTHSVKPFVLTIPEAGAADSIFCSYFGGNVTGSQNLAEDRFAYSVSISCSPSTPYQTWTHAAFADLPGTFQHPDAAISADPDGDGLGNGLEYTFGSNPRDPSSGRAQAPSATSSGCFFLLPTTIPSGIRLRVEGSGNLTNWTTHATRPSGGPWTGPVALTPDGSFTRHTFTDPAPSTRRFFRLAAEEP